MYLIGIIQKSNKDFDKIPKEYQDHVLKSILKELLQAILMEHLKAIKD